MGPIKSGVYRSCPAPGEKGFMPRLPKGVMRDGSKHGGFFIARLWSPDYSVLKYEEPAAFNSVCNAALDDMNNVYLRAATQTTAWFAGIVDNAGYTQFQASDTATSHTGWTESVAYTQSNRPSWSPGASSAQSVSNSAAMTFTLSASTTMRGAFIISNNAKGGTSGLLLCTATFPSGAISGASGDNLQLTYVFNSATQ